MLSLNAAGAAPATTGRDPQAIDRHGGAIDPPNNTPSTEPTRVSRRGILALHNAAIAELQHDVGELRAELEMLWAEIEPLHAASVYCEMCGSSPCVNPSFCETCRRIEQEQLRQPPSAAAPRPTPQTVVEAVLHCVRERGVAALQEPINRERLARCDAVVRQQINARIEKLSGGAR
jgi:hypothetical protein